MHSRRLQCILFSVTLTAACGGSGGGGDEGEKASGGSKTGGSKSGGASGSGGSKAGNSGGKAGNSGGAGGSAKGGSGGSTASTGGSGGAMASGGTMGNDTLAMGLIGLWQFEEGSGTSVNDTSGQNNAGTVVEGGVAAAPVHGNPAWGTGKVGKGLVLDGVDDWVRVQDSDSLDSTGINNAVSISAWVKFDQLNTVKPYNIVVQRHEVGTRIEHFALGLFEGVPVGIIHFFYAYGPQNVPLGEWVHMAQTYDGITQRVYVNGAEVSFLDVGWPIAADDTPLTIGAGVNDDDVIENIIGTIDEVRLYNRTLMPEEVALLAR